jgi:hypothetical protein
MESVQDNPNTGVISGINHGLKIEIVSINDKISIHFMHVPEGFNIMNLTYEHHQTKVIGKLKQFNRVKLLEKWKENNGNLVEIFTGILRERGWDFNKFPNPVAYAVYYHG